MARYHGPTDVSDTAESLSVSPDGRKLFVTGTSSLEYITLAYDTATGGQLWVSRYELPVRKCLPLGVQRTDGHPLIHVRHRYPVPACCSSAMVSSGPNWKRCRAG